MSRARLELERCSFLLQQAVRDAPGPDTDSLDIQPLESRVMLNATPLAPVAEAVASLAAVEAGVDAAVSLGDVTEHNSSTDSSASAQKLELVVVDSRVEDAESLLENLTGSDGRQFEFLFLDSERDGIAQISERLSKFADLKALHIISHGSDGQLYLGNSRLDQSTLQIGGAEKSAGDLLSGWQRHFSPDADILFYGCNFAESSDGKDLIKQISTLTGADVSASDDLTGHHSLGGDWELEYATGVIEVGILVGAESQQAWHHSLMGNTITVTTAVDELDGDTSSIAALTADSGGTGVSFREAILAANNTTNLTAPDEIHFNIAGAGPHTITLSAAFGGLPTISEAVIIDATTEPDFVDSPVIGLNGINVNSHGLGITNGGSTIRGLLIANFSGEGIYILGGSNNTIQQNYIGVGYDGNSGFGNATGGITIDNSSNNLIGGVGLGNVVSDNGGLFSGDGIEITGASATGNVLHGNYIGTNATGTAAFGNTFNGIFIANGASNNQIGGANAGEENVISGNVDDGIEITGSTSGHNVIEGNLIGVASDGLTQIANSDGIWIEDSPNTTIGGSSAGAGNVIAGNTLSGIGIAGDDAVGTIIQGNWIGTDATGAINLGHANEGIIFWYQNDTLIPATIGEPSNTTIGGTGPGEANVIAFNGTAGVWMPYGTNNTVRGNQFYSNSGLAIDLSSTGVTANDSDDSDAGPNNLQNFPTLSKATADGSDLIIIGSLTSAADTSGFQIDYYATTSPNSSSHGGATRLLATRTVSTVGNVADLTTTLSGVGVTAGEYITATATDANGNTSEFAANVVAGSPVGPLTESDPADNEVLETATIGSAIGVTARAVDPDGDSITYSLDDDVGGQFDIDPSTGVITVAGVLDFESSSSHNVVVRATSSDLSFSTENFLIQVLDAPATFSATGAATTPRGVTYTLNLAPIDPGLNSISQWTVNWGDGNVETFAGNPGSVSHTYLTNGLFDILVSMTDATGTYHNGTVIVPSQDNGELNFYNQEGQLLNAETGGSLDGPENVVLGPDGLLYVSSFHDGTIKRYTTAGIYADGASPFWYDTGSNFGGTEIVFDDEGFLYAANYADNTIHRIDSGGTGSVIINAGGGLNGPVGLDFGPDGNLYVTNWNDHRVLRFDGETFAYIDDFVSASEGGVLNPAYITFANGDELFVTGQVSDAIHRYDQLGNHIGNITHATLASAQTRGIELGPDGLLYVTVGDPSGTASTVQMFDPSTGAYQGEFLGNPAANLSFPGSILFTPELQVTVTGNSPPQAVDDTYYINVNQSISVAANGILANDTDLDLDGLFAEIVSGTSNGSLGIPATGLAHHTNLTNHASGDRLSQYSPDGSQIVFVSNRTGFDEVYKMDSDGTNVVQLTFHDATARIPSWSPDGSQILFHSNRDGDNDIYLINADGSNLNQLTSTSFNESQPDFSPDGTKIVYVSDEFGTSNLFVMNSDGSSQTRLTTTGADRNPRWSPDGSQIAFTSDRNGNFNIYKMNADGSGLTQLTNDPADDRAPEFSPDGTLIVFYSQRDGDHEVFIMDSTGANQTQLTFNGTDDTSPAFLPDGSKIIFETDRDGQDEIYHAYLISAGAFNYTPDQDFVGTDSFTYKANDSTDRSNLATVSIVVTNTLVVDTANDVVDGNTASIADLLNNRGSDGLISLREAIIATNNTTNGATPDIINFNISGASHRITPGYELPTITDAVIIDGWTEPDFVDRPVITLDGEAIAGNGLRLGAGADGSTIRGLIIRDFGFNGIQIEAGSDNNTIVGNFVGALNQNGDGMGTGQRNDDAGIRVLGANNTIGGTTAAERNIISGNSQSGIQFDGSAATGNVVHGNYVGLDFTGTAIVSNALDGIRFLNGASNNFVGGTGSGEGNVVSGNLENGISIFNNSSNNQILGNLIGTDAAGTGALGNMAVGVGLYDTANNNQIGSPVTGGGNVVANNGGTGVALGFDARQNSIRGNSIFDNASRGIDLEFDHAVMANDPGDADVGANNRQNFPVIQFAETDGASLRITGFLDSVLNQTYDIDVFIRGSADPSGHGEGRTFLGTFQFTPTSANDVFAIDVGNATVGDFITTTATDSSGNTSEFSAAVEVTGRRPVLNLSPASISYIENHPATLLDSTATLTDSDSVNFDTGSLTVDISAGDTTGVLLGIRNEGTGPGQIGVSGSSISFGGTTFATATGGTGATPLVFAFNSSSDETSVSALLQNLTFENTSENPTASPLTVRIVMEDDEGLLSSEATKTVNMTAVNDSPSLGNGTLTTIAEDTTNPSGSTVGSLLSSTFSDVDGDGFAGIAITSVSSSGEWQYSSDGTAWATIGPVNDSNALVLATTSMLRFVPSADDNGNFTASVRALDSTYAGSFSTRTPTSQSTASLNVSSPTSSSSFSHASSQLSIDVTAVNDPTIGSVTLTGTPAEGSTLAVTDSLSDADGLGTITYHWQRNGVDTGFTGSSYLLTQVDVGSSVTVVARHTDGGGTAESQTSNPLGPIANISHSPSGIVTISGIAVEGQTLTASDTLADADGIGPITYHWFRNGIDTSVTGTNYLLSLADVGTNITVEARFTDGEGTNETMVSNSIGPINNLNTPPTLNSGSLAAIDEDTNNPSGASVATLFASHFSDVDGDSLLGVAVVSNSASPVGEGVWQYSSNGTDWASIGAVSESNGLAISASSFLRFLPAFNFNGSPTALELRAIDSSQGGGFSVTSPSELRALIDVSTPTSTSNFSHSNVELVTSIDPVNDPAVGLFAIVGTAEQGQTLTAVQLTAIEDFDGVNPGTVHWIRDGVETGVVGTTYTLAQEDVGTALSIEFRFQDDNLTQEVLTSSSVGPVANVNDPASGSPVIDGPRIEDQTLIANTSAITDVDGIGVLEFQWLRDGVTVSGSTNSTYLLDDVDVGSQISVVVSYFDTHGTLETLASSPTTAIANVNDAAIGEVIIEGTILPGETLTAVPNFSDPDGLGVIQFQWQKDGTNIVGATSQSYVLTTNDIGSEIAVIASFTDGHGTPEGSVSSPVSGFVAQAPESPSGEGPGEEEQPVLVVAPPGTPQTPSPTPPGVNDGAPNNSEEESPSFAGPAPSLSNQGDAGDDELGPPPKISVNKITESNVTLVLPSLNLFRNGGQQPVETGYVLASEGRGSQNTESEESIAQSKRLEQIAGPGALWDDMDDMREDLRFTFNAQAVFVGTAITSTAGLTVGYVVWTIRSGVLLTTLLAQMPAWRLIDPLVIMNSVHGGTDQDEESIESIAEGRRRKTLESEGTERVPKTSASTKTNAH